MQAYISFHSEVVLFKGMDFMPLHANKNVWVVFADVKMCLLNLKHYSSDHSCEREVIEQFDAMLNLCFLTINLHFTSDGDREVWGESFSHSSCLLAAWYWVELVVQFSVLRSSAFNLRVSRGILFTKPGYVHAQQVFSQDVRFQASVVLVTVCDVDNVLSCLSSPLLHPTFLNFIPLPEVTVMQTVKVVLSGWGSPSVSVSGISWDFFIFRARFEDGKIKSVDKSESN